MDKIVVDSSVVIKWFVVEPHSTQARNILDVYQTGAFTVCAPDLISAEVGNIVWKKHRFQGMAIADADQIIGAFRQLALVLTPAMDLLDDAFRLAVAHERTVYDSLYLALSVRERCPYVTADEKLANAVSAAFPNVWWVAKWQHTEQ